MLQVVIGVHSGAASFRVTVQVRNVQWAVSLVRGSYPGAEASLAFSVDTGSCFAGDDSYGAELVAPQTLEWVAA